MKTKDLSKDKTIEAWNSRAERRTDEVDYRKE